MSTTTQPSIAARKRLEDLVVSKVREGKIDIVEFVDELLAIARSVGELECTLSTDRLLRFRVRDHEPFEIPLERALGRLRMICARLAVLCQESGSEFMPYGGEGVIRKTWKARWTNTTGTQEFTLSAE